MPNRSRPDDVSPKGNENESNKPLPQSKSARRRRRKHVGDPDGGDDDGSAESEIRTDDPVVDGGDAPPQQPGGQSGHDDSAQTLIKTLNKLLEKVTNPSKDKNKTKPLQDSASPSWKTVMGPQRGVKWRGGAPPLPPTWSYQHSDIR